MLEKDDKFLFKYPVVAVATVILHLFSHSSYYKLLFYISFLINSYYKLSIDPTSFPWLEGGLNIQICDVSQ